MLSLANLSAQTFLDNVGSVNGGPEEKLLLGDALDRRAYDEGVTLGSLQELDAKRNMDKAKSLQAEYEIQNQDSIRRFQDLDRRMKMAEMEGNMTMLPKMQALKTAMLEASTNKANFENDLSISNLMFNKVNRIKAHLEAGNDAFANNEWRQLVPQAEQMGIQLDPNKIWTKGDMPALTEMVNTFGQSADLYRELNVAQAQHPGKSPLEIANLQLESLLKQQKLGFNLGEQNRKQVLDPLKKSMAGVMGLGFDKTGNLLRSSGGKSAPVDPLTAGMFDTITSTIGQSFDSPTDAMTAFRTLFVTAQAEDGTTFAMPANLSEEDQAAFEDLYTRAKAGEAGAAEFLAKATQEYIKGSLGGN